MATTKKQPVYFTKILAVEKNLTVMLSHFVSEKSEPSLTRVFIFDNGEWFWLTDVDEIAYGITLIPKKGSRPRETLILGREGAFIHSPSGSSPLEGSLPDSDTLWTDITATKDGAFACGTGRALAVYTKATWKLIKPPLSLKKGDWNGVSATANDSMVVCGDNGSVYSFDGTNWSDMSIKENLSLSTVCASGKDRILVGSDGVLWVREGNTSWQKIALPTDETVESILDIPLGIFALTGKNLYEIKNKEAISVLASKDYNVDFADCDYSDGTIWICGGGNIISLVEKKSNVFVCPENKRGA
jgi:hypothetical protein